MRLAMLVLWISGIYKEHNVWGGWFWPMVGWFVMPRMTGMLSLRWMLPDQGPPSLWTLVICLCAVVDILNWE